MTSPWPSSARRSSTATLAAYGRLDFAHNNAGIDRSALIVDTDDADFERILRVNLWGVWSGMKAQIPAMIEGGGGAIVNTSSLAGVIGAPTLGAYVASKHAVLGLTKTAGRSTRPEHPRQRDLPGGGAHGHHRQAAAGDPRRPSGDPGDQALRGLKEIAAVVVWLCSDAASFVTGIAMPVDGGATV